MIKRNPQEYRGEASLGCEKCFESWSEIVDELERQAIVRDDLITDLEYQNDELLNKLEDRLLSDTTSSHTGC